MRFCLVWVRRNAMRLCGRSAALTHLFLDIRRKHKVTRSITRRAGIAADR